jgi:coenzyme PQQ precursor peptide PqqA
MFTVANNDNTDVLSLYIPNIYTNSLVIKLFLNYPELPDNSKRRFIMWTTPAATELRLGMEITAYVMNR